ncbi:MAG: type II toxin-antitoxin system VapC family toxin [Phycisphaerae bacterium]
MEKRLRVYVDTSVFGGVFDREFSRASEEFFTLARIGKFILISSGIVEDELKESPQKVRSFFDSLSTFIETADLTPEAIKLQTGYIEAGIVSEKWLADAAHVAIATVSECSMIVSWNFKHLVNFKKVQLYNAVNILKGYSTLSIISPPEVIGYYEENEKEI